MRKIKEGGKNIIIRSFVISRPLFTGEGGNLTQGE
jgi:hypothetical protein